MTSTARSGLRLRRDVRRAAAARLRAAAALVVVAMDVSLRHGVAIGAGSATSCSIVATHRLPQRVFPVGQAGAAFLVGGISDLAAADGPRDERARVLTLWAITDRGPNGTLETPAGKRRTLLDRDFVPTIVRLGMHLDHGRTEPQADPHPVRIEGLLPLANASGRPLSGRPNGRGRDEPILDPKDASEIPPDPDGIDSEGLVRMRDGGFWVAEEYRPSLLQVSPEGRAVARYVPVGQSIPGAGMDVHEVLPAAYGHRKDNRGFEAIAASPDQSRLWLLLQSPLEYPAAKAAKISGNVRLLAFGLSSRRPVAEYIYRLGDPEADGFLDRGAVTGDGKLCAIAAIDERSLLVLEQADGGMARLYACSVADATDTLGRSEDRATLEQVVDLPAAGLAPTSKRLVADLSPLLPRMAHDVYSIRAQDAPSLKLEGMAILDARHVVIVNDNDFGVAGNGAKTAGDTGDPGTSQPHTCLWTVELAESLWPETSTRASVAQ